MSTSLKNYRDNALDDMLNYLWRQWSALGVPGYRGKTDECAVVDPEATLALTCTFGRYDPRLFDEALNWLLQYERFINVQRLHTLFRKNIFSGKTTLAAIAATLQGKNRRSRWRLFRKFAETNDTTHPFFLLPSGKNVPVGTVHDPIFERLGWQRDLLQERKHSIFRAHGAGSLLLRMRALLGVNARCEILLYLMIHTTGYPSEIAAETHYAQKTVHDALNDMVISGYLSSKRKRRERLCRVNGDQLPTALLDAVEAPTWINWPVMLGALETAWCSLDTLAAAETEEELQRSCVRDIAETLVDTLYSKRNLPTLTAPDPRSLP
ncbi:MAG: hypothetical protein KAH38_10255, partial [Candidatus Hydrogenedentes bacterium]|nr:hypothetical protein [Candidatus Hydrogenedentota bacterium]